jgi:hypothetical protein
MYFAWKFFCGGELGGVRIPSVVDTSCDRACSQEQRKAVQTDLDLL